VAMLNRVAAEHGLGDRFRAGGPAVNPYYLTLDGEGRPSFELRTLFSQEMIRMGVLMPWLSFSYRHGAEELEFTERAVRHALSVCARAVEDGYENLLVGQPIRPVFRKYN